ncbi:odorant receptor 85b-like [Onthophagus taurus]|uniref:odorant receptor 85b-like n=1 Tax=Onthophagus taurus TaxID=166361 RepID=UPI0039BDA6EE
MLNLLSDFNHNDVTKRVTFLEKNMESLLKTFRFVAFISANVISYYVMWKNKCINFMITKHCFMFEYYVPFQLEHRGIIFLIILFQIYSINVVLNAAILYTLLYVYSFELLIARTEILQELISNIHLSKNKKRNYRILRPIVLYQQDFFRVFQITKNFFINFLVPVKMFHSICLTASITDFALRKDLLSVLLIIMSFSALLISHTIGQRFTTAAGKVSETTYNINWYEADVSTRKDVLILLSMTQKILMVELPLFGSLSHVAAAKDFNKVYALYNWMLTITKKLNNC